METYTAIHRAPHAIIVDHETWPGPAAMAFRSKLKAPVNWRALVDRIKNGETLIVVNSFRFATATEPAVETSEIAFATQEDLDAFLASQAGGKRS